MRSADKSKPLTGAERQARYRRNQQQQSRRKAEFWVTDDERRELTRLLEQLRESAQ